MGSITVHKSWLSYCFFIVLAWKQFTKTKKGKKQTNTCCIFSSLLWPTASKIFFFSSIRSHAVRKQQIYIYILFIVICPISCLLSESTITFHFAQRLLVSIYCIQKKRNMLPSLRAPHLVQLFFLRVNIYLIIYSSVITQVFSNKVFMISYSTRRCVASS